MVAVEFVDDMRQCFIFKNQQTLSPSGNHLGVDLNWFTMRLLAVADLLIATQLKVAALMRNRQMAGYARNHHLRASGAHNEFAVVTTNPSRSCTHFEGGL